MNNERENKLQVVFYSNNLGNMFEADNPLQDFLSQIFMNNK